MNFLKHVKHFFIPHEGNSFKPHIFHELSVLIILAIIFTAGIYSIQVANMSKEGDLAAIYSSVIVDLTNQDRKDNTLLPLKQNDLLVKAAKMKADDMSSKGYFSHISPEGISPWYWIKQSGYKFVYAGENLAIDFSDSYDVERAWMNSPLHKANILKSNYTDVGVATAEGVYEGRAVTFVVQMFGSPASPSSAFKPLIASKTDSSTTSLITVSLETKSSTTEIVKNSPNVLGADVSVDSDSVEGVNFIETKNTGNSPQISKENTEMISYSKWYEKIISNPGKTSRVIYLILAIIISLSLITYAFVEWRVEHPKNILYGFLLLFIILLSIFINYGLFVSNTLVL